MVSRKVIAAPERETIDLGVLVREYTMLKQQKDALEDRLKQRRDQLSNIVEQDGESDDKGHLVLDLPEPVEGFKRLVRQRRVKRQLDEHVAERILDQKELAERCYQLVPVLNEDAVMQCLYEGLLTEADIDKMFPTTITWAFLPVKD